MRDNEFLNRACLEAERFCVGPEVARLSTVLTKYHAALRQGFANLMPDDVFGTINDTAEIEGVPHVVADLMARHFMGEVREAQQDKLLRGEDAVDMLTGFIGSTYPTVTLPHLPFVLEAARKLPALQELFEVADTVSDTVTVEWCVTYSFIVASARAALEQLVPEFTTNDIRLHRRLCDALNAKWNPLDEDIQ